MDPENDVVEKEFPGAPESNDPETLLEALQSGLNPEQDDEPEQTESEAEKAERLRDEAGRFAKKPAEPEKPAAEEDETAMPEGLSEKAQERFRKLASRVHEYAEAAQAAQRDIQAFREVISETGASPQDFGQALDYLRAVNRGDMQGALRMLDEQRRMISLAMGQPIPGADALAEFPDLRQRVEAYQMDESAALEIARARVMQREQMRQHQSQQQGMQRQQAQQQERANAIGMIDQMGAQWTKSDPDYQAKESVILKQLPSIAQQFPPGMWAHQVRMLYDTLSAMPMPQPARTTPAPLRASGQTAGAREPGSMLEALQSGLGYMNG